MIGSLISLPPLADLTLEYVLGFGFGWTIFQALFMRSIAGGSYSRSLRSTFTSELLSMNCLMGGMIAVSTLAWKGVREAHDPTQPLFWFRMSLALMFGFVIAYPMNWWLVANHLKHGMMTVRRTPALATAHADMGQMAMGGVEGAHRARPGPGGPRPPLAVMTVVSVFVLAAGLGGSRARFRIRNWHAARAPERQSALLCGPVGGWPGVGPSS